MVDYIPPAAPIDVVDTVLMDVQELWQAGDFAQAAEMLREVGRKQYSYYRMDEVLFELGKVNVQLKEYEKAAHCFALLHRYFPRAAARFEFLPEWEEEAEADLAQLSLQADSAEFASIDDSDPNGDSGPLISNVFYETDIRQALTDLAAQTGINIVPGPKVRGYVTAEFIDEPLDRCLEKLLTPLGFSYGWLGDYYIVGAPEPDSPIFPLIAESERIELEYLNTSSLRPLLSEYYLSYLHFDDGSNSLVITAPRTIIDSFHLHLASIDQPTPQIMIEAMVVEMNADARRTIGLDWDWTGTRNNASLQISKLLPSLSDSSFVANLTHLGESSGGAVFDLSTTLRLLATSGRAQIKANPRIATSEGRKAQIQIGREAYYSLVQGNVNYSYVTLEKITTGIALGITPYVGSSGEIDVEVVASVSDVTGTGVTDLPVTNVRSVESRIRIPNGETLGIGGLVLENTLKQKTGIPYLKDIPLLGDLLFSHTTTEKSELEVVILITPHILIDPALFDAL